MIRRTLPAVTFLVTAAAYGAIVFGLFPREPFLKYPVLARQALAGTLSAERWLDLSPIYLLFHQLLAAVGAPAATAELCQVLAVALATAILAATLRPRMGLAATLGSCALFAASGGLVTYTATLEPEAFLVLAVTVFLAALLATPRRPLVAGLALVVAGLLRPNLLPLAVLVPFGFWLEARAAGREDRRAALRAGLRVALPVVLGVAILLIRNASLVGPFTPFVMNPGTVFFEGNHPWAEGTAATYPPLFPELVPALAGSPDPQHELYRLLARRGTGRELSVTEVNAFWRDRARAFLADHPGRALVRGGPKLVALLGGYSWHDLATAHWNERSLGWPARFAAGLLLALALVGAVVAWGRRLEYLPVLGVVALQLLVAVGIYASARQRLAAWPALAVLAALALAPQGGARRVGARSVDRRGRRILVALLLALFVFGRNPAADWDRQLFTSLAESSELAAEARALRGAGRLEEAADRASRALAAAPWRAERLRPAYVSFAPDGYESMALRLAEPREAFDRGLLLLGAAQPTKAEAAFVLSAVLDRPARREGVDSPELQYYRALAIHRRGGDPGEVRSALTQGLEGTPGDPEILAAQAVFDGDPAARSALFRYWDPITANFFLGREALRFGRPEAALEPLFFVRERLPELRRGAIYLAAALAAAGRPEEGARVWVEANRGQQEPVLLEPEILSLFRSLVLRHPEDPTTLRLAGAAHRQFGHYPEAESRPE